MIISHSRRFVFIHIPKCAGTSFEDAYLDISRPQDFVSGGTLFSSARIQDFHRRSYKIWKHSTAAEVIASFPELREYRFLALTRDAKSRVLSLWNYLTHINNARRGSTWTRFKKRLAGREQQGAKHKASQLSPLREALEYRSSVDNINSFVLNEKFTELRLFAVQGRYVDAGLGWFCTDISSVRSEHASGRILEITGVDTANMPRSNKTRVSRDSAVESDLSAPAIRFLENAGF